MDGDGQLTGSAKKFDQELEATVSKLRSRNASTQMGESMSGPVHVMKIAALRSFTGYLLGDCSIGS